MTEKDDLGVCTSTGEHEFCCSIEQVVPCAVGTISSEYTLDSIASSYG